MNDESDVFFLPNCLYQYTANNIKVCVCVFIQVVAANSNHEITSKAACCHIKDSVNVRKIQIFLITYLDFIGHVTAKLDSAKAMKTILIDAAGDSEREMSGRHKATDLQICRIMSLLRLR